MDLARPVAEFFADAAAGTLPQVSFIDPTTILMATSGTAKLSSIVSQRMEMAARLGFPVP